MAGKRRAEITDETIAALPYARGDKRYSVTDPDCRGLVIRVAKATRSYHLQMRDALGRPRRWHIDDCDNITLETARAKVSEWRAMAKRGLDPQKEDAAKKRAALENTFGKAAESFVSRHLKPNNRTWAQAARQIGLVHAGEEPDPDDPKKTRMKFEHIKGSLAARWEDRKVAEISRAEITAVLDSYVDRGAAIMANRVFATLRKFFNWLLDRGTIEVSPLAGKSAPSDEKKRDRVLTNDELVAVWNAADAIGYPFGIISQLLIATGQRRSEVGGMRWSELDLAAGTWTLPPGRVKNKTGHVVPLSPLASSIIEQVKRVKGCPYLFSRTGDTAVSGFSKAKTELDKKAGILDWRLHDLRRTAATGMADLGIQPHIIEAALNHVSGHKAGVAGIYNRSTYDVEKRSAFAAWGRHVAALVGLEAGTATVSNIASARARKALR